MNTSAVSCAIVALTLSTPLMADTLFVPAGFPTIDAAIAAAQDGDTVELGAGVFNEAVNFQGKNIEVRGQGQFQTILSGLQLPSSVVTIENGEGSTAVLRDLTVFGGEAGAGGGINIRHSSPHILNCRIIRNGADFGGGLFAADAHPLIEKCVFIGNVAQGEGGGLGGEHSTCELLNCVFLNNSAVERGGGLAATECEVLIRQCEFRSNEMTGATGYGGGMGLYEGYVEVIDSTFRDNSATNMAGIGMQEGQLAVFGSTFTGNEAAYRGGAMGAISTVDGAHLHVVDCTLQHNRAQFGGGLAIQDAWPGNETGCTATVQGSRIIDNAALEGGGVYARLASLDIHDSELAINSAELQGGGVYAVETGLLLESTVLRGNTSQSGGGIDLNEGTLELAQCTFDRNTASVRGGGLRCVKSAVTDDGSTFRNCSADFGAAMHFESGTYLAAGGDWQHNDAGTVGGGLMAYFATIVLDGTYIAENSAGSTGGGLACGGCDIQMLHCTLSGNHSDWTGGGAFLGGGSADLLGTDFQSNHAINGGGLTLYDADPTIDGCTFTNNQANNAGGGIYSQGEPWISNTLFCNNLPDDIFGPWQDLGGNTFTPTCCPYDVNTDGNVDIADVIEVWQSAMSTTPNMDWDFNGDGQLDFNDALEVWFNIGNC
jgi:predicted outer membrane repeat protein